MKIAFVSANREKLPDAVVPLGLLYVVASTPERHPRSLVDLCFEREPVRALRRQLAAQGPDLVAIGLRNIQNNHYAGVADNLAYYEELVAAARSVSSAPIVLGGAGFSVMPDEIMRRLQPDFGLSGEAEATFPALVETLEKGSGFEEIGNLHWFERGTLRRNAPGPFLALDALPVPDRALVDTRYYERFAIESVQTKRGCPLRCDYCTYPLIEGRSGRMRTPSAVVDEMVLALDLHPRIRHFFVVDSVFNLPRSHAKTVCRELIARRWRVPWTCYANPLGFDRELAQLARDAGCAGMEIGSDSGNDEVLARLRKGFTTRQVRDLHEICADVGLRDCHTFILATRGETIDDVRRTLDFVDDLDPWSAIFMLWVDDREAVDPALRAAHQRLRGRAADLLLERAAGRPHWSIPPLGVNFDEKLFRRLRRRGMYGPLWQHMRPGPIGTSDRPPDDQPP